MFLDSLRGSSERGPSPGPGSGEQLPIVDEVAKAAAREYQVSTYERLIGDPREVFDVDWDGGYSSEAFMLHKKVFEETGVWLNHEQLAVAHLKGRQEATMELATQRILGGDPNSSKTLQRVNMVREELVGEGQQEDYDRFCHDRMIAVVDLLVPPKKPEVLAAMLDAYNALAQTPELIRRDANPARAAVLQGIQDLSNILDFGRSPSGETVQRMDQLGEHYADATEVNDLFIRDKNLVNRLQTIIAWQYTETLKELESQKFSAGTANQASLLSELCKQLKLTIPEGLQRFEQDLASPDIVASREPATSLASLLPNGLADITITPDGSRGRFGSKLVVAGLMVGVVGGATNFAPAAVGAITISHTQETGPSTIASPPIALKFPKKGTEQPIKPDHKLHTQEQLPADTTIAEQAEPEVVEAQTDEQPQAEDTLLDEPVALEFPEDDSWAEEVAVEDVDPSEGIAVPTLEQEIREEAKDTQGRSREKLDAEFDQIAQANYATGESVAGKDSHKVAQDAFKKAITYLDAQQTKRETNLTDEEKTAQQTEMYWLLTGHAGVILNNPDVVIDDAYLQELMDLLKEKQTPADEAFMAAIMLYWADEKNGFSALADIDQSDYTQDQLDVIQLLLAVAAFDAMPVADKAAILKNYGEQPEQAPEQQGANDQAGKDKKPNQEKDEKDRRPKDKETKQETKQGNYETDNDQIRRQVESITDKLSNLEPYKKRFIADIATGALRAERDGAQINIEVTIAQAILESGWGQSGLASKHNNIFGMKAGSDWDGPTVVISTKEFDSDGNPYTTDATWRVYSNVEASVKDYAHNFIGAKEWYQDAQWFADNPAQYIDGLIAKVNKQGKIIIPQGKAGAMSYATDPDYKPKLMSMVGTYRLREIADINKRDKSNIQDVKDKNDKDKAKDKGKNHDKEKEPKTSLEQEILEYPGVDEIVSETDTGAPLPNELREVVYYSQWDERWANKAYNWPGGDGRTISSSGCGPSSQAIVISTLSNKKVTPVDMAEWNLKHGYRVNGGTAHAALVESARAYGLEANFIDDGIEGIRTAVKNGKLVIVNGTDTDRNTPATDAGHIYVVTDVAPNGDFIVSDPNSITKSLEQYDPATIANAASIAVAVGK